MENGDRPVHLGLHLVSEPSQNCPIDPDILPHAAPPKHRLLGRGCLAELVDVTMLLCKRAIGQSLFEGHVCIAHEQHHNAATIRITML